MIYRRGDVLLGRYPYADASGAKRRPVLVVQGDAYNSTLQNTIVVQITSNLGRRGDAAHLLIEVSGAAGKASGLITDSLISCVNLTTIHQSLIDRNCRRRRCNRSISVSRRRWGFPDGGHQ